MNTYKEDTLGKHHVIMEAENGEITYVIQGTVRFAITTRSWKTEGRTIHCDPQRECGLAHNLILDF